ncbi:hypothetical protein [Pedobacter rhodius]|uniref:Bacteriocin-type signal sequence-containing protein n=1 Tax=Pedobacter rhodius TaxID=3004098 RepID=A0ABT4KZA7_9SPHI|nr:hypothetical protein [Pedobacter sp. SJ11]MCZ4224254.1 hypothetical protein [Pedobacter sp. SJ11]
MKKFGFGNGKILTRKEVKEIFGGVVKSDNPACLDQCQDAETDCNGGEVCWTVETAGCEYPYMPKKCVRII